MPVGPVLKASARRGPLPFSVHVTLGTQGRSVTKVSNERSKGMLMKLLECQEIVKSRQNDQKQAPIYQQVKKYWHITFNIVGTQPYVDSIKGHNKAVPFHSAFLRGLHGEVNFVWPIVLIQYSFFSNIKSILICVSNDGIYIPLWDQPSFFCGYFVLGLYIMYVQYMLPLWNKQ